MNSKEFIFQIIELYQSSRNSKFPIGIRGRSHTISSYVEDLFGYYLGLNNKIASIYIDQPISVIGLKKIFYPDIITINNNEEITNFFDLKMDLGWMRDDLIEFALKYEELINMIKGKSISLKHGKTKEIEKYEIKKNIKFNIVIISGKNISESKMKKNIEDFNNLKLMNVNLMVLTGNIHPNEYGINEEALLKLIDINYDAFNRINTLKY